MLGAEFWGKHSKMKIPTLLELSTLVETDNKQIIHHIQVVMKVIQVIKKNNAREPNSDGRREDSI